MKVTLNIIDNYIRVIMQLLSLSWMSIVAILLTLLLGTVETITIKPRLALTLEGTQSIDTSGTDVTGRGAAFIYI